MARAVEVTGWAGLWLRIDGPGGQLAIDNMEDQPLRGVTGWARADIVLDVPEQAAVLNFGALLSGASALDVGRGRIVVVFNCLWWFRTASIMAPRVTT